MTLALQERQAWRLYLAQTRNLTGSRYYAVEPWAWAELQRKLIEVHRKRERVAA